MFTRSEVNAVRRLCRQHFGHHALPDVPQEVRQRETADYIRSLPPERRVQVLASLRRNVASPLHPPDVRGRLAELVGMVESQS